MAVMKLKVELCGKKHVNFTSAKKCSFAENMLFSFLPFAENMFFSMFHNCLKKEKNMLISLPQFAEKNIYLKVYNFPPHSRGHEGRRGTGLRLPGPSPFPLLDDRGREVKNIKFYTLKE